MKKQDQAKDVVCRVSVGGAREQRAERRCVWGCFNCRTHGRSHSEGDGHQPGGGEGGSSVDLSEETSIH